MLVSVQRPKIDSSLILMFGWLPAVCSVRERRNLFNPFCSDLIPLPNRTKCFCPAVFFHHGVQGLDVPHTTGTPSPSPLSPPKGKGDPSRKGRPVSGGAPRGFTPLRMRGSVSGGIAFGNLRSGSRSWSKTNKQLRC